MRNDYQQIQSEVRAMIMLMRQQNSSVREIARTLSRAPSTISPFLANPASYDPVRAGMRAKSMKIVGFAEILQIIATESTTLIGMCHHRFHRLVIPPYKDARKRAITPVL